MAAIVTTKYIDTGVQTSPNPSATRSDNKVGVGLHNEAAPVNSRNKRVTYLEDSSQYESPASRRVYPRTPINIARTKACLPHYYSEHPPSPPVASQIHIQRRVVSLPEYQNTLCQASHSSANCLRSVSMPLTFRRQQYMANVSYEDPSLDGSSSLSFDKEDFSQMKLLTRADISQSSSTFPSQHSSIEIIDDSFQLPESFIQSQSYAQNMEKSNQNDWITWATSPPRPIPALHGPASLPYARCPSGAEGTVIEEPSTVPGLIWGLINASPKSPSHSPESSSGNTMGEGNYVLEDSVKSTSCVPISLPSNRQVSVSAALAGLHDIRVTAENRLSLGKYEESLQVDYMKDSLRSHNSKHEYPTAFKLLGKNGAPYTSSDHPNFVCRAILRDEKAPTSVQEYHTQSNPIENVYEDHSNYTKENSQAKLLDPLAKTFIPYVHSSPASIHEGVPFSRKPCSDKPSLREYLPLKHDLPTPPDSTRSLWTNTLMPVFEKNVPDEHQALHSDQVLRDHIEELTGQLKQLILQQQRSSINTAPLKLASKPVLPPIEEEQVHEINMQQKKHLKASDSGFRPSMPINLPMLVAHMKTEQTPILESPTMLSEDFSQKISSTPGQNGCKPFPESTHLANQTDMLYNTCDHRPICADTCIPAAKRNLRSVPLSRLLEKKLAPVLEETSFEVSPPTPSEFQIYTCSKEENLKKKSPQLLADITTTSSMGKVDTRSKTKKRQIKPKTYYSFKSELDNHTCLSSAGKLSSWNTNHREMSSITTASKRKIRIHKGEENIKNDVNSKKKNK